MISKLHILECHPSALSLFQLGVIVNLPNFPNKREARRLTHFPLFLAFLLEVTAFTMIYLWTRRLPLVIVLP